MSLNSLEENALSRFEPSTGHSIPSEELDGFLEFGLRWSLRASERVRLAQLVSDQDEVEIKADGSPTTTLERSIELMARDMLSEIPTSACLVGEETGGVLPDHGYSVAIDPIDGTWAYLSGIHTYALTLAIYLDREPVAGFVASPASGEIGYSARRKSRLLKLGVFGEPSHGFDLPVYRDRKEDLLVNLHPGRRAATTIDSLYAAWSRGEIRMVRSASGSPAWGLLDASKGRYVYANLWDNTPSTPYDLAAGVLLVRTAGGDVVDLEGNPIDVLGHRGPFVAAIDHDSRNRIVEIVRESVAETVQNEGGEN